MPPTLLGSALLSGLALTAFSAPATTPAPIDEAGLAADTARAPETDLPSVKVRADAARPGFRSTAPAQLTKSATPPGQTPFSIDVLTRDLLDSQQAHSLADALQNASGVVAGNYGRRGWDDVIIRGQTASDSLFLDGLRTAGSNRVAEQTFGLQRVEVFKGPASLLFGQVLPGGLVNMVSKRPQDQAFQRADLTVGSNALRQGSVDINQPLDDSGRAALRINASALNSDDATDHVWFRERWIAPSLSLDFGEDTDFVLLTSYQQRSYIRQQGLPLEGSVLANPNGTLSRSLFTGEPTQQPYDAEQARVGYLIDHRFDNGWILHQGLRWQQFEVDGDLVSNNGFSSDLSTLKRTATHQSWRGRTWVQDTYLSRSFDNGAMQQTVTLGLDAFKTWEWTRYNSCSVSTLKVYSPVYNGIRCASARSTDTRSVVSSGGLYARDQLRFGSDWQLLVGLRHDRSAVGNDNALSGVSTVSRDSANTGSAALMYDLRPWLRPYVSYASSFYPNSGSDAQGKAFDAEQGQQWEAGIKLELFDGAAGLTTALYDLRRRNVLQDDPVNDGYSMAIGEQRSRGGEINLSADLGSGISVNAGYAYTDAVITDDGGQASSTVGERLNNVPRHSGSLWLRYEPHHGNDGWNFSGGLRSASDRYSNGYVMAGYTVFDAGVGYRRAQWHYALNVRNLFDHVYFAGGLARAVALGDRRTLLFNVGFSY